MSTSVAVARTTAVSCGIAYAHMLACVRTELRHLPGPVRILDIGCGTGTMLSQFASEMGPRVELYGVDVAGVGFDAESGFHHAAVARLEREHPLRSWRTKVQIVPVGRPWPFPDGYFDLAVSNQVLEHVQAGSAFFGEIKRVLRHGGVSVHCWPLRQCIQEGHVGVPFAHWIRDRDVLVRWLSAASRLGMGRGPMRDGADVAADAILFSCYYRSRRQIEDLAINAGLRPSWRYTAGLYRQKLRAVMGRRPVFEYGRMRPLLPILSRISSVTLRLENRNDHSGHTAH